MNGWILNGGNSAKTVLSPVKKRTIGESKNLLPERTKSLFNVDPFPKGQVVQ